MFSIFISLEYDEDLIGNEKVRNKEMGLRKISYESLWKFVQGVLTKAGLDPESVEAVTLGLCETSLRGVDTHGIRLLPHYVNSAEKGRKNPRPQYKITKKFPTVVFLDADHAFGHAAGMKAIDLAMGMAQEYGVGIVGVGNSSHPGAMASFALKAARKGYLCLAFTHADALLLSSNGIRPYFGTNPLCFSAPREEGEPYCLDMASSCIPWNKVRMHMDSGEMLPPHVAADERGQETQNPQDARCLLPTGGYKGYGIASMVEVLCAIFTGMSFGRQIPSMFKSPIEEPRRLGQFYMVMRADGCVDPQDFLRNMQAMTDEVRKEPSQAGLEVMLPGDKEEKEAERRKLQGIPLEGKTLEEFLGLSERFGIPLSLLP